MPVGFLLSTQRVNIGTNIPVLQSCNGASISVFAYITGFQAAGGCTLLAYSINGAPITISRISLIINGTSRNIVTDGCAPDSGAAVFINTGYPVPLNQWIHIVTIDDFLNDRQRVYVDGVEVYNAAAAFTGPATSATVVGNASMPGEDSAVPPSVFGNFHDARLYNRALSAAEVQTIYNSLGTDDIVFGLQARWELSEFPSGGTASAATIKDSSVTKWPPASVSGTPSYTTGILRIA